MPLAMASALPLWLENASHGQLPDDSQQLRLERRPSDCPCPQGLREHSMRMDLMPLARLRVRLALLWRFFNHHGGFYPVRRR